MRTTLNLADDVVRLLDANNPAFTRDSVLPAEALAPLGKITALPRHEFWPDDLSARDGLSQDLSLLGPRQVTDAYLVSLAVRRHGLGLRRALSG